MELTWLDKLFHTDVHRCSVATLVSLRNRTAERRGRQNAWAWQTWQACYVCVLWWSSLNLMFSGLLLKDLFKGGWSTAEKLFKQNYCHTRHTKFAVFFPLPSCCVSSLFYATGRQGKQEGKTLVRDKRDGAIACRDLHLTLMFFPVFYENICFSLSHKVCRRLSSPVLLRTVSCILSLIRQELCSSLPAVFGAPLNSFLNDSCEGS